MIDLTNLSDSEQRTALLISSYVWAASYIVTEILPRHFHVTLTQLREKTAPPRAEVKLKPLVMRYRSTGDRIIFQMRGTALRRVEFVVNGDARCDGFDHALLSPYLRHDKLLRRELGDIDNLEASLASLAEKGMIFAPRWEPYVGLCYVTDELQKAVQAWNRRS